jgi:hypothetical protein
MTTPDLHFPNDLSKAKKNFITTLRYENISSTVETMEDETSNISLL